MKLNTVRQEVKYILNKLNNIKSCWMEGKILATLKWPLLQALNRTVCRDYR